MALITKAIRGTQDVLPQESYQWQVVERTIRDVCKSFGYREIRTPVFEHTELFQRGVGDTTDVVQKEMYTFEDKGGRSLTLRPEGTAGAMRAVLEHNLHTGPLPVKAYYFTSCYRYEKPQAGRLREFHQFGAEVYGTDKPVADAEIILLADNVLQMLGLKNISLEINSIGCPQCRSQYHQALKAYFTGRQQELCSTCRERLQKNPMRILDCKCPSCQAIARDAPVILSYLCQDCKEHFEEVQGYLEAAQLSFTINPRIVRGLDYYTRTVFEFISNDIGAQGTVCGGGRYDGLAQELGGAPLPALGFAMGLERILLALEALGGEIPVPSPCELYIAPMDREAAKKAFSLVSTLREEGFEVETDLMGRSLKAQMKYADKLGARFTMVLGEEELKTGRARLKDMSGGESREVCLGEELVTALYHAGLDRDIAEMDMPQLFEGNMEALLGGLSTWQKPSEE